MTTAFEATTPVQQESNLTSDPEIQKQSTVLDSLVGEGKKFASTELMAIGKVESDNFILRLQAEAAELRSELDGRLTAEETVAKLMDRQPEHKPEPGQGATAPLKMSTEDITDLVKNVLNTEKTATTKQGNLDEADRLLTERFGDKRAEWLTAKAQEIGSTVDFLKSIAEHSPSAFVKTVGLDATAPGQGTPLKSDVNTDAPNLNPGVGLTRGTNKFYSAMRKTDPKLYFSAAIQNEMFESLSTLGSEKFYA